ncbi:HFL098Cp [Eremothecium sinecaudum]|uniref:HFL098Cp n=1 Tax=Eremothecium sinecaudum TaxID=45286 RepID=A0A0X8HUQ9_9SACH|nr:HFL098Cp [Eremothecium sinecaudum]AMD21758.1 HFL098Cp [Eremothecium sinecaudum]
MNEFAIPIRKYSQYSLWEPAPQGFKSPKVPLLVDKWKHFPMRENLLFKIGNKSSGTVKIIIVWNDIQVLEEVTTSLQCDLVQFSFKAPSISCKYLYTQGGQTYIRRFQVGFQTGYEFLQTKEVLIKLGFCMRNAFSMRQNSGVIFNNIQPNPSYDYSGGSQIFHQRSQVDNFNTWMAQPSQQQVVWNVVDPVILSQSTPLPPNCNEDLIKEQVEPNGNKKIAGNISKETNSSSSTMVNANSSAVDKNLLQSKLNDRQFMKWVCIKPLIIKLPSEY